MVASVPSAGATLAICTSAEVQGNIRVARRDFPSRQIRALWLQLHTRFHRQPWQSRATPSARRHRPVGKPASILNETASRASEADATLEGGPGPTRPVVPKKAAATCRDRN